MTQCRLVLILTLTGLVLAGCQGGNRPDSTGTAGTGSGSTSTAPKAATSLKPTGHLIEPYNARKIGYGLLWATSIGMQKNTTVRSWIFDNILILAEGEPANIVTAINVKNGTTMWRRKIGQSIHRIRGVARKDEIILVNTEAELRLFEAETGRLLNSQRLDQVVAGSPVISGDLAVFGGIHGKVFAHDIATGSPKWRYNVRGGIVSNPVDAQNNHVFVADSSGFYAMFLATNGKKLWDGKTFGKITTQAIASNLGLFIACEDHNLYALNKNDGRDRVGWPYRTQVPLRANPVILDRYLFLQIRGRGLVAIDAARRTDLWEKKTDARPVAIVREGLLLVDKNKLILVDVQKGNKLNEVSVKTLETAVPGPKRSLILISPGGRILRLDPLA